MKKQKRKEGTKEGREGGRGGRKKKRKERGGGGGKWKGGEGSGREEREVEGRRGKRREKKMVKSKGFGMVYDLNQLCHMLSGTSPVFASPVSSSIFWKQHLPFPLENFPFPISCQYSRFLSPPGKIVSHVTQARPIRFNLPET